jgi:hypothetical protein
MGKNIDETTKKEIFKIIKSWVEEWISTENIERNIKRKFEEYRISRVNTISRSEVSRWLTYSRLEAWNQAWVEEKEWYTALDGKVCPMCWPMHWKRIALNKDFYKLGDTLENGQIVDYEDIQGAPLHPSCRCDLLPVIN